MTLQKIVLSEYYLIFQSLPAVKLGTFTQSDSSEEPLRAYLKTFFKALQFFTSILKSEELVDSLIELLKVISRDRKMPIFILFTQSSYFLYLHHLMKNPSFHPNLMKNKSFVDFLPTIFSDCIPSSLQMLPSTQSIENEMGSIINYLHEQDLDKLKKTSYEVVCDFQNLLRGLSEFDILRSSAVTRLIEEIITVINSSESIDLIRVKIQMIVMSLFTEEDHIRSLVNYINILLYQTCPLLDV